MNKELLTLIETVSSKLTLIEENRIEELDVVVSAIQELKQSGQNVNIIVVCTHNSRRSQLGEVWINILAYHFGISALTAYSGGMEDTAFNERMVTALLDSGVGLKLIEEGSNPRYIVEDIGMDDHVLFSKAYDHAINPQSGYIALMVCDHADENCPVVIGMKYRIPLRYKDPKEFDDTEHEEKAYREKVLEVGREMYYIMDRIK